MSASKNAHLYISESSPGILRRQFSSPFKYAASLVAIIRFELLMLSRNPAFIILSIGLLAFCQLLTPTAKDPYAVITVNGMKPLMAASPMLACIGILLGVFLFPVYTLFLGDIYRHERSAGISPLFFASAISLPPRSFVLALGKLLASALLCIAQAALALALCIISIRLQAGAWPSGSAALCFGTTLFSVILVIALLASGLSIFLPKAKAQVFVTFCLWISLLLWSILGGGPDLFGIRFIGENLSSGDAPAALAVGFIEGRAPVALWTTLHNTQSYLDSRYRFALLLITVVPVFSILLGSSVRKVLLFSLGTQAKPARIEPSTAFEADSSVPRQLSARPVSWWKLALITAHRLVRTATLGKALVAATAAASLFTGNMRSAVPIALLIPLAVLRQRERRVNLAVKIIEHTTPSLWRPTPCVVKCLSLVLLTVAPILAILLRNPNQVFALVQFATASVALCGWLIFAGGVLDSELLATTGYCLVWYGMGCNQLPQSLDIFALVGASPTLFSINFIAAVVMCITLARADRS